jgi:hypothetical protein
MGLGTVLDECRLQHGAVEVKNIAVPAFRACILAQCSHAGIVEPVADEDFVANSGAAPDNKTKASTAETNLKKIFTAPPRLG